MIQYISLLRFKWKYVCGMRCCSYNKTIWHIAIKSRIQLVIKNATNDLLSTAESKTIACPILRINPCCTDFKEILNEGPLLLVSTLDSWYIYKSSDCATDKCGNDEQQQPSSQKKGNLCFPAQRNLLQL